MHPNYVYSALLESYCIALVCSVESKISLASGGFTYLWMRNSSILDLFVVFEVYLHQTSLSRYGLWPGTDQHSPTPPGRCYRSVWLCSALSPTLCCTANSCRRICRLNVVCVAKCDQIIDVFCTGNNKVTMKLDVNRYLVNLTKWTSMISRNLDNCHFAFVATQLFSSGGNVKTLKQTLLNFKEVELIDLPTDGTQHYICCQWRHQCQTLLTRELSLFAVVSTFDVTHVWTGLVGAVAFYHLAGEGRVPW